MNENLSSIIKEIPVKVASNGEVYAEYRMRRVVIANPLKVKDRPRGSDLEYINFLSEDLQIKYVSTVQCALSMILRPSKKVKMAAVGTFWQEIRAISDPCDCIKKEAIFFGGYMSPVLEDRLSIAGKRFDLQDILESDADGICEFGIDKQLFPIAQNHLMEVCL